MVIGTLGRIGAYWGMDDDRIDDPLADLDLEKAIHLRWTLRDIKGRRLAPSPVADEDIALLTARGLVEVSNGVPRLTEAGHDAIT